MSNQVPDGSSDLPAIAALGAGTSSVAVVMLIKPDGGWHVAGVYYRVAGGPVMMHPTWPTTFGSTEGPDPEAQWTYLAGRVLDGSGGNYYSYELEGFEVATVDDIRPVVTAREAEIVASNHPIGEPVGTINVGNAGAAAVSMPFVVLPDERGHVALVATDPADGVCQVLTADGKPIAPSSFVSLEHWQRAGAPSWPLTLDTLHEVRWGASRVFLTIGADGTIDYFGLQPPDHDAEKKMDDELTTPEPDVSGETAAMLNPLRITRAAVPRWILTDPRPEDTDGSYDALGGQLEWNFATPWIYRALASPSTGGPILAVPRPGDPHEQSRAYWTCLLHMLLYGFGWTRPERGLRWWYAAGRPTHDLRLQLLSDVWYADGQLELLLTWLAATSSPVQGWHGGPSALAELCGYHDRSPRLNVDARWLEQQHHAASVNNIPSSLGSGGWDPLHLSVHALGPIGQPHGKAQLLRGSQQNRTATLTTSSMMGWYRSLIEHGKHLPDLHGRSWNVDVFVKPVGWLGTYRQSRATGIWFAGAHSLHVVGT